MRFLSVFCHIPLYSLAPFPNNATPTGGGQEARCVGRGRPQLRISRQRAGDEPKLTAPAAGSSGAPLPSAMTWADLMTPGHEDLGWLPKAPAARPRHPAVEEPESKRGNGRITSPKDSAVAQNSFPIRQNTFSPVQKTYWNGWRLSDVHILVNKLLRSG